MPLNFNGAAITKETDPKKLKSEVKGPLYGPGSDDRWYYYLNDGGVLDIFTDDKSIIYIDLRKHK